MKRRLFQAILVAFFSLLIAFIVNMLSDELEVWCKNHLGDHYLYYLGGALFVLFIAAAVLGDWKTIFSKNISQNKVDEPTTFGAIPLMESEVIDEVTYNNIYEKLEEDKLQDVIALMRKLPFKKENLDKINGRWQDLAKRRIAGTISTADQITLHNQIRTSLLDEFNTLVKEESQVEPDTSISKIKPRQQVFRLEGGTDKKLSFNRNFIGRKQDIRDFFKKKKAAGGYRMLVTGTGGMGKTDFCKAVLKQISKKQPELPIFWVDVEAMTSLQDLLLAFAHFFDLPETQLSEHTILEAIKQETGLYYLDNLESLLGKDTKANQKVLTFLQRFSEINNITCLASSRDDIAHWKNFKLKQLSRAAATQLFLEEWNESSGQNLLKAEPAWEDFVEQDLGAHPLSIVLTASHGQDYGTISAIMKAWRNLDMDIAQLYASEQSDSKQDSLDTSIVLSANKLTEHPKAMLLWSLFLFHPEGMSREEQTDWMEQGAFVQSDIRALLQRNLLQNRQGTFWMLPPLIRFASIHTCSNKFKFSEQSLFEQSLQYGLASFPNSYISGSEKLLDRLPFLFLFLNYFAVKLDTYPQLLEVDGRMLNFYNRQIWDGKRILHSLLSQTHLKEHPNQWATCEGNLGKLEFRLGNNEKARIHFESARKLYERTGSELGRANCELNLGKLEFLLGNNEEARIHFDSASKLYERTGDEQGRGNCEVNLGTLEFLLGNNEEARIHFESASKFYERTGDEQGRGNCEVNLGKLEFLLGNNEEARMHFESASKGYEKTGDEQGKGNCELNLGKLEFRLGNNEEARMHFESASKLYERTGDELGRGNCEGSLGELEFRLGNTEQAKIHFEKASKLYEKTGSELGSGNCERNLGALEFRLGNNEEARMHFVESIRLAKKCGYILGVALANLELAKLEKAIQNETAALEKLQKANTIAQGIQHKGLLEYIHELQEEWANESDE